MSASRERHRSRNFLVVIQIAMALVLLVSAGLMIRTFQTLRTVEPGFTDARYIQTMRISIPATFVAQPERVTRIQNNIVDKLAAIPGVTSVGFASELPMEGIEPDWSLINYVEGKDYGGKIPPLRTFQYVSPGFFHAMGTRIVAGRDLTWTDVYGLRPVAIISENLARELWGTPSAAIGKRFGVSSNSLREVVGVVENVRENGVEETAPETVYWPSMMKGLYGSHSINSDRTVTFAIRSNRAGTASFVNEIRKAVWSVNASLPVAAARTMQDIFDQSTARTSFTLVMLGIAGTMAFVLGIVGIYGVISYAVSQRRHEIGIRLALGAPQANIRRMFVRSGLMLAGVGVAAGVVTAIAVMGLMKSLLFGISPLDPVSYVGASLVLTAATVAASYLPARRAAALDPVEVLKAE